jgi:hypothetical protein
VLQVLRTTRTQHWNKKKEHLTLRTEISNVHKQGAATAAPTYKSDILAPEVRYFSTSTYTH